MSSRMRIALAGATAGLALAGAGLMTTTAQAAAPAAAPGAQNGPAAAPCWYNAGHWWCNNKPGAAVWAADSVTVVGRMYSNPSWFTCRLEANPTGGGGPHPNRWLLTKADNGKVGWMKDSDVYSETNSVPAC